MHNVFMLFVVIVAAGEVPAREDVTTFTQKRHIKPLQLSFDELAALLEKCVRVGDEANLHIEERNRSIRVEIYDGADSYVFRERIPNPDMDELPDAADGIIFSFEDRREAPISEIRIALSDWSQVVSVSGTDRLRVEAVANTIERGLAAHECALPSGAQNRFLLGGTALVIGIIMTISALAFAESTSRQRARTRRLSFCFAALGVVVVVAVFFAPWTGFLPGFRAIQDDTPFYERHGTLIGLVLSVLGIVLAFIFWRRPISVATKDEPVSPPSTRTLARGDHAEERDRHWLD